MGKFEATQGQWKQVMGKLPGPLTTQLPEGDDFPVGNVNFAEAEAFCQRLTEIGHQSGELPNDWQFRLPTEAQWEYACRAGTTTATAFEAVAGPMTVGPVDRLSGCGLNRNVATTTSASESQPSNENKQVPLS